ncbi:MAG: ZIP family metal transporter [Candidatus Saccharibacteria bacterium]
MDIILIIIVIVTVLSTLIGGLFAIKFRDRMHLIMSFGAGAILGVALFDLLPESIELAGNFYGLNIMALSIALGFSLYMLIDRFLSSHDHCDNNCSNEKRGKFGASAITLHSLLDGFSIGIAFKVSPAIGWTVALAIMMHSFSDGVNTVNMFKDNKKNFRTIIKWLIIDTLAPTAGIVLAFLLVVPTPMLGLILSVFVGLFLYLSTSSLIPESHHNHPKIWTTISTIAGILFIFLITFILG